jgi:WXG100 family type VII secretion target
MSMQSMSVQTAQVVGMAGQIRNGASGIRSELDNLDSKVRQLLSAWSGEAQTSYHQAQARWTKSLGELQALLERIASSTEQIAQTYDSSDGRNAGRFAG